MATQNVNRAVTRVVVDREATIDVMGLTVEEYQAVRNALNRYADRGPSLNPNNPGEWTLAGSMLKDSGAFAYAPLLIARGES